MSQRLTELCEILVENAFGELAARIFSTLAEHGRMTILTLQQYTHISLRRLKAGIGILTLHHILLYHAGEEYEPTSLQIDWDAAYNLLRTDTITKLVTEREGEAAGKLVTTVLRLGHATVGDLAGSFDLSSSSKRDSGIDTVEEHMTEEGLVNGIVKDEATGKINTLTNFHSMLHTLLSNGYLVKVGHRSYIPQADLSEQLQHAVISARFPDGKVTGPKKQKEFKTALNDLKRKWQDEDVYSEHIDIASKGAIKRSKVSPTNTNKRVRVNGDLTNGIHHHEEYEEETAVRSCPKLPNDMLVRVSLTKCVMILRSQRLQDMAERFLGPTTAAVYSALLRLSESKVTSTQDKYKAEDDSSDDEEQDMSVAVSDAQIEHFLDISLDLTSTIKGAGNLQKLPNGTGESNSKPEYVTGEEGDAELGIKQEPPSDDEDEPDINGCTTSKERFKRLSLISMHLDLLAEHPKRFCVRLPGNKASRLDFAALAKTCIQAEIDVMVNARFGKIGLRIVRMLRAKGKLEEKQITKMCIVRLKDVRTMLTLLQFHGVVEIQELPKDNARVPARTTYLWSLDEAKVQDRYLLQTYHGMARTLQRLRVERDGRFRSVIEKAERKGVKGRELELLAPKERELLEQWRKVEEQLLGQVDRMDDLVALLRDFGGKDTSLTT